MSSPRYQTAHLADPSHILPLPGRHTPFSSADEGEPVDTFEPFIIGLLNDGSLRPGPRPRAAAPAQPEPEDAALAAEFSPHEPTDTEDLIHG